MDEYGTEYKNVPALSESESFNNFLQIPSRIRRITPVSIDISSLKRKLKAKVPSSVELSSRIQTLLLKNADKVLLEDSLAKLQGQHIHQFVQDVTNSLLNINEKKIRIAVVLPLGSIQAAAIMSVLHSQHSLMLMDYHQHDAQLKMNLEKAGVSLIITDKRRDDLTIGQLVLSKDKLKIEDLSQIQSMKSLVSAEEVLALNSSGSTGTPKTILLSHKNLAHVLQYIRRSFALTSQDKALIQLPVFHTMSLNTQFLPSIMTGTTCIFSDASQELQRGFRKVLSTESTFLTVLPTVLESFGKEMEMKSLPAAEKVRIVQIAGGLINRRSLETAERLFPNATIYKGYGMTELIRASMISNKDPLFLTDTVGYPLPGQEVRILSSEDTILPSGETGEIIIKGPSTMLGYLGQEASHLDQDGFFRTGDYGHLDSEGRLYYSGRKDHVFKAQGKKVAPYEIEKVAQESTLVRSSCCVAFSCDRKGLRPILIMEVADQEKFNEEERLLFANHLKANLDRYKVPKTIIVVDKIARLPNGKIDRVKIQQTGLTRVSDLQSLSTHGGIEYKKLESVMPTTLV